MKFSSFVAIPALAALAHAHGFPQSFTINGQGYPAYDPMNDPWQPHAPKVNRPIADDGPLYSKDDPNLTCNKVGTNTPAEMTADAAPGSEIIVKWNRWPSDHKGPVVTYAKYCGPGHDDCNNVPAITDAWFKIDEAGYDANTGQWASDQLIAQDVSWTFNLPPAGHIAQGSYLIRHEIIALHSQGAPQFYPHCIQIYVTGGTGGLDGQNVSIPGTVYSKPGDDGTLYGSIYGAAVSTMSIPGPSLAAGAISNAYSKRDDALSQLNLDQLTALLKQSGNEAVMQAQPVSRRRHHAAAHAAAH